MGAYLRWEVVVQEENRGGGGGGWSSASTFVEQVTVGSERKRRCDEDQKNSGA